MSRSEDATTGLDDAGVGRRGARHAPMRVGRGRRWSPAVAAAWIVVLAYGWWFTDRRPFSRGAFLALVVAVVVLIVGAEVRRARAAGALPATATGGAPRLRSAVFVWSALSVAVVAWELIALRSLPRSAHPTISSLVESAEQYHVARVGLYAAWVWFGWTMVS
jgi:hypothetical protein